MTLKGKYSIKLKRGNPILQLEWVYREFIKKGKNMVSDLFPIPPSFLKNSLILEETYKNLYDQSLENPENFWGQQGGRISWIKPYTQIRDVSFEADSFKIRWYEDGTLNASYNCIDRHLLTHKDRLALIWEGDSPEESQKITYGQLYEKVCQMAHVLKNLGVQKGDRVVLYLPMIPEAVYAMLACARMGAIHCVVFGGFSAESLADRIQDTQAQWVITADESLRGGRVFPLKNNVDKALEKCSFVSRVLVIKRTGGDISWDSSRDRWFHEEKERVSTSYPPEEMKAEDPLFILYTSGSTKKPKGILHTTGGYLVYSSLTFQYIFDYKPQDIFWCTADVGWITGHSYLVYGPLLNGATVVLFEGVPSYPDFGRFWEIIDRYGVTIFYTAPTAIRSLMGAGDSFVTRASRGSLRLLGSVGEPMNPEAWLWYHRVVGNGRCPIVDTWWQTETGGILISPLPGAMPLKPGSATLPFLGINPVIVGAKNEVVSGAGEGNLCIQDSWPGQARTIYGDHQRFIETYFTQFPGRYFSGDGCRRDEDGYYWITGRVDDVINVSGHRLGTAEIESALVSHHAVAEAAVVGYPHPIKGQGIYAYVTLKEGIQGDDLLKNALKAQVRQEIGAIAIPEVIQWAPELPKTRSGKIMRRILRKIVEKDWDHLGDTSTLSSPSVVEDLIEGYKNLL